MALVVPQVQPLGRTGRGRLVVVDLVRRRRRPARHLLAVDGVESVARRRGRRDSLVGLRVPCVVVPAAAVPLCPAAQARPEVAVEPRAVLVLEAEKVLGLGEDEDGDDDDHGHAAEDDARNCTSG